MGAGLLHPRTRKVSAVAVIAMHTAILVTLGPLGRSWNSVVWPWNLTMITLVVLLFGASSARPAQVLGLAPPRSPMHVAIAFLFWFMPALSVFGLWDSYLSAALYSQNLRHGAVKVSADASARLPEEIRRHIESDSLLWLQDWALAELNAPVYPEARVFEKITRSLCKDAHAPDDFVLLETSKPDLFTGERTVTTLRCDELG